MNIIKIKNLEKQFKSYERGEGFLEAIKSLFKRKYKIKKAVDNVSFDIKEGDVVGFLGPNGAGKSTTLKILTGIMHPDSGEVKIMSYIPWKHRTKYVRNIGAVFGQKSQLMWDLPPIDAFHLHKGVYSLDEKEFKKQLDFLTTMLDIKEIMGRPTRQLSLGERMRCEFVIALLHKPDVVFLDEPTIGLDVFAKEIIRKFIKEINKKNGTTFIVTSHDLEDIEHLCNRIIVINEGKVVFDDKTVKLKVENKKIIQVKFYKKINYVKLKKIKSIKIKQQISDYVVEIEANTKNESIDSIIKKIRLGNKVEDLEITNPPITDIIKKLYHTKHKNSLF